MKRPPNPDAGPMAIFVFAVVVVCIVCVALLLVLDAVDDAPVGQLLIGMVR